MSTDATNFVDPVTGEYTGPMFDAHDYLYMKVFCGLVALTALEVALSYSGLKHASLAGFLLSLAAIKFTMVAAFFMHLKYDTPLFRRLFVGGAVLAGFCYLVVLTVTGALRTPRAGIPVQWWIYLVAAVGLLGVWVVPHAPAADGHAHDGHDHADHDHADHAHADHDHAH